MITLLFLFKKPTNTDYQYYYEQRQWYDYPDHHCFLNATLAGRSCNDNKVEKSLNYQKLKANDAAQSYKESNTKSKKFVLTNKFR